MSADADLRRRMAQHANTEVPPINAEVPRTCVEAMRAADALKYAAAIVADRIGWTEEAIGCSDECAAPDDERDSIHDRELSAMRALVTEVRKLAAPFGDPRRYSDGRQVTGRSAEPIPTYGGRLSHIWHPDPSQEKPNSWCGQLLSDPGVPSPGCYTVSTDPTTQTIDVKVVRLA